MASTAIDVEQTSLNQRSVLARVSSDYESEKAVYNDARFSGEGESEKVWQPEDA